MALSLSISCYFSLCALRALRSSIKKMEGNIISYGIELEAGVLEENIPNLNCRTITCTGLSPECNHQLSLCSPCRHNSGAICPHILCASNILLRFLMRKYIEKRKNTAFAELQTLVTIG